jgi:hypothetical protein
MVGGFTIISNLQTVLVSHVFPEGSIPLYLGPWIPWYAIRVKVSSDDSATLPNESLPVQLSRQSLTRMRVLLVVTIDDPRYALPFPPEVGGNDISVCTSASIRPLINHQAAPAPFHRPNSFTFSYFVCRVADTNSSSFSWRLLEANYIRTACDFCLQRWNGPLV